MELSEALITGKGITLAEALSTGGKVTVLGLAIVFSVLIVLMLILMLFRVIFYKDPKKQAKKAQAEETTAEAPQSTAPQVNEEELIAVLTAAVAASLNTSTYNLQIKSYRRIEDKKPAWNRAGLRETINNRF